MPTHAVGCECVPPKPGHADFDRGEVTTRHNPHNQTRTFKSLYCFSDRTCIGIFKPALVSESRRLSILTCLAPRDDAWQRRMLLLRRRIGKQWQDRHGHFGHGPGDPPRRLGVVHGRIESRLGSAADSEPNHLRRADGPLVRPSGDQLPADHPAERRPAGVFMRGGVSTQCPLGICRGRMEV
jgi:hypothetical protein